MFDSVRYVGRQEMMTTKLISITVYSAWFWDTASTTRTMSSATQTMAKENMKASPSFLDMPTFKSLRIQKGRAITCTIQSVMAGLKIQANHV